MATIKNANDIILQATNPRLEPVPLPGTYFIPGTTLIGGISADTLQANATNAVAIASAAEAQLASIADDSILSPGEKPAVMQTYDTLIAEQSYLVSQANALNITTEKNQYNNAISALILYLGTIPGWNVVPGTDVAINLTTFNSKFVDVYTKKQILLNKLADVASTLATWNNVTGAGKPVDDATKNTGLFATLTGQVTSSNYATYLGANAVSNLGFSQNTGSSGSANGSSVSTTLVFNSDGANVVILVNGVLSSPILATDGVCTLTMSLTVNGVNKLNVTGAALDASSHSTSYIVRSSEFVYVASPGAGNVNYTLTLTFGVSGNGSGGSVGRPSIQVIGLKR